MITEISVCIFYNTFARLLFFVNGIDDFTVAIDHK